MAIVRTYLCPYCNRTFDELHMDRNEGPPAFCKLCGHSTAVEQQVTSANLNGVTAKAIDHTVAEMDRGSTFREHMVEQVTGDKSSSLALPAQDLQAGEAIKFSTDTPVHKFMKDHAKTAPINFQNRDNVAQFTKSMRGQPGVGEGINLMRNLTSGHALRAAAANQLGRQNKA